MALYRRRRGVKMNIKNRLLSALTAAVITAVPFSGCLSVSGAESGGFYDTTGGLLSVTDYGAEPGDSVDDSQAINKALRSARDTGAEGVYVPEGKYYINSTLFIYSDTRLILDKNAVICSRMDDAMLCPLDENNKTSGTGGYGLAHDIYISGGKWDAGGSSKTLSKPMMVFRNSRNITVTDTVLTHCYGNHFIICDGIDGVTVTNTSFEDFVSYTGNMADYDFVKNITDAGKQKSAIGAVEALHIDFASDGTPCKNVKVTDCTFSDVPSGVGTHHTNSQYATNIDIYNNSFKDVWFACVRVSSFKSLRVFNNTANRAAVLFRSEDTQAEVYGNTFTGLDSVPSSRYDTSSTIHSVLIQDNSSVNFHDNVIRSSNGIGATYMNNGSLENIFTGNTIEDPAVDGMYIDKSKLSVTCNTFRRCGRTGVKASASTVTCNKNNIVFCKDKFADFYAGCKNSTCKDNGISSGAKSYFAKDSSVSVSGNLPSISEMTVSIPKTEYGYTGSAIKPSVILKDGSKTISSSEYKVSYKNNTNVGKATILIEGTGDRRGFIKKTFTITSDNSSTDNKPIPDTGIKGDANGDGTVNVRDAAIIAKMLADGTAARLPKSADYNGDGKVSVRDAAAIAKQLAG